LSQLETAVKFAVWPAGLAVVLAGLLLNVSLGVLAALLLVASALDLKARKIPNRLVYTGLILGILCQISLPSGGGVWVSVQGMGLGLAIFLPMYFLRAMGAGDVKLMAMVGSFTGPQLLIGSTLATLVSGGVMAVFVAFEKHEFGHLIENIKLMIFDSSVKAASGQLPAPDQPVVSIGKLPYAIAITVGTLGFLFWNQYAMHQ
jgi:prepilin peptidase CpaA